MYYNNLVLLIICELLGGVRCERLGGVRVAGFCFFKFASVLCFFVLFVALFIVHNVVSVSGLSIHDCPFGFL